MVEIEFSEEQMKKLTEAANKRDMTVSELIEWVANTALPFFLKEIATTTEIQVSEHTARILEKMSKEKEITVDHLILMLMDDIGQHFIEDDSE